MMISPEEYRKELKNLTLEELSERKEKLEKFINDYENNNLSEQKYKLFKEYLGEVAIEFGLRRHQSEWEGVKVFESQCANCKNYLGDINYKIYGEIAFDILENKKVCPDKKDNVERNDENHQIYIECYGHKIKITCYLKKLIDSLKDVCNDFIIDESYSNNEKYFFAYSEELGIILTGIEEVNQRLIHYLYFCGKDSFAQALSTYRDSKLYDENIEN